jgi:hypothetical protein
LAGLILINAVLLASLVVTGFAPKPAQAQLGGVGGEYLMIAGEITGRSSQAAVYIIDLQSAKVAAVIFNGSNSSLEIIAGRDVSQDQSRPVGGR